MIRRCVAKELNMAIHVPWNDTGDVAERPTEPNNRVIQRKTERRFQMLTRLYGEVLPIRSMIKKWWEI